MTLLSYPDIIQKAKAEKHITNARLAIHSGADETQLSRSARGLCKPPKERFLRPMAELLEIDSDDLVLSAEKCPAHWIAKLSKDKNLRSLMKRLVTSKTKDIAEVYKLAQQFLDDRNEE